jgi:hypothetical protein
MSVAATLPTVLASQDQPTWIQYLPLITAAFSAVVAIIAVRLSVHFASKRAERNCALGLLAEIGEIHTALQGLFHKQPQTTYVQSSYLSRADQLCTVYRGAGSTLGLLDATCLQQVVAFYGSVLTLTPLRDAPPDAYAKPDLTRVMSNAELCQASLRRVYADGLAANAHD